MSSRSNPGQRNARDENEKLEQLRLPGLRPWSQDRLLWRREVTQERPLARTTSDHLARLWVMDCCDHLNLPDSVKLASQYRLITRWSAAVVLESDADYASKNLKTGESLSRQQEQQEGASGPVAAVTNSSVPEPEIGLLALLVAGALARRRKK